MISTDWPRRQVITGSSVASTQPDSSVRAIASVVVVALAVFVGVAWGWKWVLAPLLGLAILAWSRAMLRGMVHGGQSSLDVEPVAVTGDERTLYWCEECGTELLLTIRGTSAPPRHCGSSMHERVELLGG